MNKEKLQSILSIVDRNSRSFPENDYLDICKSLKDIYQDESDMEDCVILPIENLYDSILGTQFRIPGEEPFYAALNFLHENSAEECLSISKKLKVEKKETSRYPLKRITNRIENETIITLCKGNNIHYDESDVPTIEKINIVTGKSYILKDECRKYINAWNTVTEKYIEDLNTAEKLLKLKLLQFTKFHKILGKNLIKIAEYVN